MKIFDILFSPVSIPSIEYIACRCHSFCFAKLEPFSQFLLHYYYYIFLCSTLPLVINNNIVLFALLLITASLLSLLCSQMLVSHSLILLFSLFNRNIIIFIFCISFHLDTSMAIFSSSNKWIQFSVNLLIASILNLRLQHFTFQLSGST